MRALEFSEVALSTFLTRLVKPSEISRAKIITTGLLPLLQTRQPLVPTPLPLQCSGLKAPIFIVGFCEPDSRSSAATALAVRSSATAEDLPTASFAGQHDSFLNISGAEDVVNAVHRCFVSLFNNRAIKYREDNGFEQMKVYLSAGVQLMVRSDLSSAGVIFTLEPESGFKDVIVIKKKNQKNV